MGENSWPSIARKLTNGKRISRAAEGGVGWMRMLGPPTPDTRTPSTVGATPALTFYPTTCTKTITPPPTPARSLPRSQTHRRPSLTALSHHRPPRFCASTPQPTPDLNRLLLSPTRTPHSLPPPSRPRPTPRPTPSTPSVTPASAGGTFSPASRAPSAVNPTGFAGTRRPAAPRPLNPHHWCDAPIAPFRQPPTDDRSPTSATSPTDKGLTVCA